MLYIGFYKGDSFGIALAVDALVKAGAKNVVTRYFYECDGEKWYEVYGHVPHEPGAHMGARDRLRCREAGLRFVPERVLPAEPRKRRRRPLGRNKVQL